MAIKMAANNPFIVMAPSLLRTASGNGDPIDLVALSGMTLAPGLPPVLVVQSDVTVISGTSPTMTCIIEDSVDGVNWNTVISLTAQTTVSRQVGRLGLTTANWPFNPYRMRARWTIGGTNPQVTFSVKAKLL